jgi:hypothetical protein
MATQDRLPTGDNTGPNGWTADDNTSYVYKADANAAQLFTYDYFSISSTAIASVTQTSRVKGTGGTNYRFYNQLLLNSQRYGTAYTTVTNNDTWVSAAATFINNPVTGVAWTEDNLETADPAYSLLGFGMATVNLAAGETAYCTQTYVTVDYTEAAATGGLGWKLAGNHPALAGAGGLAG